MLVCYAEKIYVVKFHASDQMVHDLARSTVANTELNGFHDTAVTAAALRTNKPPGLGCEKILFSNWMPMICYFVFLGDCCILRDVAFINLLPNCFNTSDSLFSSYERANRMNSQIRCRYKTRQVTENDFRIGLCFKRASTTYIRSQNVLFDQASDTSEFGT